MKMQIRPAAQRGGADHGWLKTQHTFSFAGYYDPSFMGFGPLRVINEDRVAPGRGFGSHGHRNMEIVSYVLDGALEHRDTLGNGSVLRPGDVQRMSAGRGVTHSEQNASSEHPVHFLQIWVLPREGGGDPGYEQRHFEPAEGLLRVVSPDGADASLQIGQDVDIFRLQLPDGGVAEHAVARRRVWVQVVDGSLDVHGAQLSAGDGLAVEQAEQLRLVAGDSGAHALLFDLP
jgi:redox-sensitive bicupin YhaK (pirin superfamily)